ncbi:erythromycin esterase family protein [Salmonella enterica]|nr:erythromycin esterase family protein [Salmonella enterica]
MKLSQLRGDTEEQFLDNLPRIMQTFQTRELIALAQKQGFPCLGIDVIPRRSDADFPQDWKADRSSFVHHFITARESDNWLSWRSAKMAQNIRDIACHNPSSQLLVFLHNMHIKRDGRSERSELRLMSAREHLDKDFAGQMYSIAQFARAGRACHNDLTAFDFEINDPQSIETLIDQQSSGWRLFKCEKLVQMKVAYHHAFEREAIDIRRQYEYAVLYGRVTPPEFIKK